MNRITPLRILATCVSLIVVAAIIVAIIVLGSPMEQRQRRLDERRVQDLSMIVNAISVYASTHNTLPPNLSVLGKEPGPRRAPTDPDSGAPYEYSVVGTESYQLCAFFTMSSPDTAYADEAWTHDKGRQCFARSQKLEKH